MMPSLPHHHEHSKRQRDAKAPEAGEHEHKWTLVLDDGEGMPYRQCRLPGCGKVEPVLTPEAGEG